MYKVWQGERNWFRFILMNISNYHVALTFNNKWKDAEYKTFELLPSICYTKNNRFLARFRLVGFCISLNWWVWSIALSWCTKIDPVVSGRNKNEEVEAMKDLVGYINSH